MSNQSAWLFNPAPYLTSAGNWQPRPHTLERVKSYLAGFAASGRLIYPKLETMAAKLSLGRRTLCRYLAHLREVGWLETVCRKAFTAVRKVVQNQSTGTSAGTSVKVTSQGTENRTEVLSPLQASVGVDKKIRPDSTPPSPESGETAPEPPNSGLHSHPVESGEPGNLAQSHSVQSRGLRPRDGVVGAKTPVNNISPVENVSRPEKSTPANFDRYFGTFEEAGVALNEGDRIRACREWLSIEEPDRMAATTDAMVLCAARKACFIPLPVNHLRSKAWTRVAKPRTLELEDPNEPWICKMAREAKKKMGIRS